MKALCEWFDVTPQAHYQMKRRRIEQQAVDEQILELVRRERQKHKRMGARKLLHKLQNELAEAGIEVGRDHFFTLLRREGLLVSRKRRQQRTTWSGLWRCDNLLPDLTITRPNQVWVCDITYVETETGFVYLALVTDLYSRRIVGFDLCETLAVEGALRAFNMAVRLAGKQRIRGLIHHSDHGVQYTCHAYRHRLQQCGVRSSMGEIGNCYDNAVAERVNGIVKLEYGLDERFISPAQARQAVRQAVWLYNHERPHLSLDMRYPADVYQHYVQLALH
jgi:transposase InsO family protein